MDILLIWIAVAIPVALLFCGVAQVGRGEVDGELVEVV